MSMISAENYHTLVVRGEESLLGKCFVCANRYFYRVINDDLTNLVQCISFDLKWMETQSEVLLGIDDVNLIFLDGLREISLEQFAAALQTLMESVTKEEVPLC